jgi:hypothetical protein
VRGVQTQIEILEKEFGRERRRPIEIHKRRRLVLREDRAHDAVVHEFEERPAAHAELLSKKRDLDEILDDDPEHDVMRDLADSRPVGLSDVEHAPWSKRFHDRLHLVESRLRTGCDARQLAGPDAAAIAADRGDHVFGAARSEILTEALRVFYSDARTIDQELRSAVPTVGEHARASEADLAHIVAGRDHCEEDVYGGQVLKLIRQLRAFLGQRLGLGPSPVPYRQSVVRSEDTFRHRITHPTQPNPTDVHPDFSCCFVKLPPWPARRGSASVRWDRSSQPSVRRALFRSDSPTSDFRSSDA